MTVAPGIDLTNYVSFCTVCKCSGADLKITQCARCKIYAFCPEHAGSKHTCAEAPKYWSEAPQGDDVKGYTQIFLSEEEVERAGLDHNNMRRINSIVHHLGPNEICLLFDNGGRPAVKILCLKPETDTDPAAGFEFVEEKDAEPAAEADPNRCCLM